jgi:hypothetical protein
MRRLRLFWPLLLTLPLAGCLADQQGKLASCEASAAAAFPKPVPGQPFKAIQACMDRAGYTFIGWRDGVICDMGAVVRGTRSRTGTDAICFEPKNWLELKFYRLLEVPEKAQTIAS